MKKMDYPVLTFQHLVFDFTSAVLLTLILSRAEFFTRAGVMELQAFNTYKLAYLFFYTTLAFGLQILFGLIGDIIVRVFRKKLSFVSQNLPMVGLVFAGMLQLLAISFFSYSILCVLFTGLANSLFHVFAGMVILNGYRKSAFLTGTFISSGALGLLFGYLSYGFSGILNVLVLLTSVFILLDVFFIKKYQVPDVKLKISLSTAFSIFGILAVIMVRSFVGFTTDFPWQYTQLFFILTYVVLFLGKSLGGLFADKFGFTKVGVISLILSAIIFGFFQSNPYISLIGILLVQVTTSITLVSLGDMLSPFYGVAFGLPCLLLFSGYLVKSPIFIANISATNIPGYITSAILLTSSVVLWFSLKRKYN